MDLTGSKGLGKGTGHGRIESKQQHTRSGPVQSVHGVDMTTPDQIPGHLHGETGLGLVEPTAVHQRPDGLFTATSQSS